VAKATKLPKNLTQSRNRQGTHPKIKQWKGKLKNAPRYGVFPEDSKTYKKDQAAVGLVVDAQNKEEQKHDKKQLEE